MARSYHAKHGACTLEYLLLAGFLALILSAVLQTIFSPIESSLYSLVAIIDGGGSTSTGGDGSVAPGAE